MSLLWHADGRQVLDANNVVIQTCGQPRRHHRLRCGTGGGPAATNGRAMALMNRTHKLGG